MKRLILIFLSLISLFGVLSLTAQKYQPMLDSVNVWSYSGQPLIGTKLVNLNLKFCTYPRTSSYGGFSTEVASSDTTLGGFVYKKIIASSPFSGYDPCLLGWVREDTAKKTIYFRDVNSVETVLYDFFMKLKDSMQINIYQPGYFQSGFYRVDSIKTVTLNSKKRIEFDLNCHKCSSSKTLSWVEGIGNFGDFVYSYFDFNSGIPAFYSCPGFPHQTSQTLTCFEHFNKVYYDSCTVWMAKNHI